jgi:two-component system chemotaxis response regulator CheY
MDGIQILSAILAQDPEAKIVMLTSLANRQTIEECLRLGAVSYIRKDTPKEAILAELSEVIQAILKPT